MKILYTVIEAGQFKELEIPFTKEEAVSQLKKNRKEEVGAVGNLRYTKFDVFDGHNPELIHSVMFDDDSIWDSHHNDFRPSEHVSEGRFKSVLEFIQNN